MKILVYGAGPLGSLFAVRLHEAGNDVSILARGQRLADLREHGVVLYDTQSGQQTTTRVPVVERLAPDDAYDLVLVIMRKNRVGEILPILAANKHTPNVLFMMNNAAGPGELVSALGQERVMLGFPMSGGYREGHVIRYAGGTEAHKAAIPIGEVDGGITERTRQVAHVLESMRGYTVEIRPDMDSWLKSHVAVLMPGLAAAIYGADLDNKRLARTRDLITLALRATREAFQVLQALHIPIVPSNLKTFVRLPEPLVVAMFQRRLPSEQVKVGLVGHARAARDEVKHLVDEFLALAHTTTVPTPNIDRLYAYFDPATPPMPDGSAEIPLRWGELVVPVLIGVGVVAALILLAIWVI